MNFFFFRERRRLQLKKWDDREKQMPPPLPRRPRLKFSAEVALLEAASRDDAAEGVIYFYIRTIRL